MGLGKTLKKNMDPEVFAASMSRLGVSITTTLNPNHRHDEKWEKELDKIREEICESHRFRSFANVRSGNAVKWYSDGHDYFWALSEMLDNAKECIFVSAPLALRLECEIASNLISSSSSNRSWTGGSLRSYTFVDLRTTLKTLELIVY